jgi:hypothetical protein
MSDSASSDEESRTLSQLCRRHQKRAMKVIHEFVLVRGGGGITTTSTPSLEQDEAKSQETETNHHDGTASSGDESSSGIGGVNKVFKTLKSEEERYEMDQGKSRAVCSPHTMVDTLLDITALSYPNSLIFQLVLVVQPCATHPHVSFPALVKKKEKIG